MKTIYIVAWEYTTGGGFDWYHTAADADKAFEHEKIICDKSEPDLWTAFRLDFNTSETDPDLITKAIDLSLEDLLDQADQVYPCARRPCEA